MSNRGLTLKAISCVVCTLLFGAWTANADDLGREASWEAPTAAHVRAEVDIWFASQRPSPEQRQEFSQTWPAGEATSDGDILDRTVAAIAIVEPRAASLIDAVHVGFSLTRQPKIDWLAEDDVDPLVRENLRLYTARALTQGQFFDEAKVLITEIEPDDVVDPASLLFCSGVVHHRLLLKEPGLTALSRLLERSEEIPERYRILAELMKGDLVQLEDDSLDHISRRMNDIKRRLDLGRANKKVREVEDGVIESLDKLIKKIEEQQQQQEQQMAASGGQGSSKSSKPAEDSSPLGGRGPGEVDKKRLGKSADWGALPDKEREEAMQEIGRDFPALYREVIEEYFKELAKKKGKRNP